MGKNLTEAKVKTVPELYKKVFAEIRKNPDRPAAKKNEQKKLLEILRMLTLLLTVNINIEEMLDLKIIKEKKE